MSPDLKTFIDTIEAGLASRVDQTTPEKAKAATTTIAELRHLLAIGEAATKFYSELPTGKRMLADTILPAGLLALLKKGA